MRTRLAQKRHSRRAVTLTELLVVLAILGLLATIAIPVYLTRMELARIRTAQAEVQEIAHAEEQLAILQTYYLPIQLLDNVAYDDTNIRRTNPPADTFDNEVVAAMYVIDPYVSAYVQSLVNGQLALVFTQFPRIQALILGWQGPYLNAQRTWVASGNPAAANSTDVRRDFPLDPWGQPYRFFSPVGPIGTGAMTFSYDDNFSDGRIQNDLNADFFDRYAIVSFGPNGLLDRPDSASYDDVVYTFGMVAPSTTAFYRYFR